MTDGPRRMDTLTPQEKRVLLADLLRKDIDTAAVPHPLSYGQQAMWYLYRLAPDSSAYNVSFTVRIRSAVDVGALRRALQGVIDRHEPLRTTFNEHEGKPAQMVHRRQEAILVETDAAGWDDDTLYRRVNDAYHEPFDLERGPMLRACLFTRAGDDHVLLLVAHHIVLDGWAVWVLLDELLTLYATERGTGGNVPPPLQVQYSDYVRWQTDTLAGPAGERLWNYWREQLSGELPVLDLPIDRPRPPEQSFSGATVDFTLGKVLTEAVKGLARDEQTTVYTVLLAAFQVLLHRYSGQEEIIVGSPMAGRTRPEFANLVGDFINVVALRASIAATASFRAFLAQVRETVLGALEHQDFPFPLLVTRLAPKTDASRSPIFQVTFDLQRIQRVGELTELLIPGNQETRVELGDLTLEPYPMPQQEGQLDVTLQIAEAGGAFHGAIKYNTDLFEHETIERMAVHYRTLLEAVTADPERAVGSLPLLAEQERRQLLSEWNATEAPYPTSACLHQLFEEQVEKTPDAVAVVFERETLTYRQLEQRANRVAANLRELAVGPGTLVGVCLDRSLDLVAALLGVLKAGGAYVPLDPAYPPERLAFMLEDSRTPVLLTQSSLVDRVPTSHQRVIVMDSMPAPVTDATPAVDVEPEHPAYVLYTSGSTGTPKGVVIPHRAIVNHMCWFNEAFQLDANDGVLQKTPYSFDASVWEFYAPILTGGRLIMARPDGHRDVNYLITAIQEQEVTILQLVPSLLSALIADPRFSECRTLRHVFCGGEELTPDLQHRFFAVQAASLHNLYGPTEATIDSTYWTCEPVSGQQPVPIGRPINNVRAYVLDAGLQPVPVGVVGELFLSGAGLATGYLHQPELTAERFIPDPFSNIPGERLYRTGDLARYRADGALLYVGRRDHQVKFRGFRIDLGEIETTLRQHPDVREVVVTARQDERGDSQLVAYFVPEGDALLPAGKLRAWLKAKLPEHMVPSAYVPLETFPLTVNGKLDRKALPAPSQRRIDLGGTFVAPSTSTERALAEIWCASLGIDRVSVQDNYFDLGGDSLRLVELLTKIEEQTNVRLSPAHIRTQTLGQVAAMCDEMIARGEVRQPKPVSRAGGVVRAMRRMRGAGLRQEAQ